MQMDKEIMKGSIDILLLSLLCKKDMYGYEIVKSLKENSKELYNMSEGTLYPALKRLERNEWIQSYWEDSERGGRRKYYRIMDSGKNELSRKLGEWKKVNDLIKTTSEGLAWIKSLNPILIKS
jgi:PadR family transcriptional regulator, regulatory protein PadR